MTSPRAPLDEDPEIRGRSQFSVFVLNVALALAWAVTTGAFSLVNLTIGFVLAFLALWLPCRMWGSDLYFRRPWRILRLLLTFLYELVVSAVTVAVMVFTPSFRFRPGVIAIPLDTRHDLGIMLFANLISLTPGTLSLDVSDDRSTLYVHAMDTDDADGEKADMKRTFEKKIREAMQ
jgi:multicomponent Na+:H+ antiporter subunit E